MADRTVRRAAAAQALDEAPVEEVRDDLAFHRRR